MKYKKVRFWNPSLPPLHNKKVEILEYPRPRFSFYKIQFKEKINGESKFILYANKQELIIGENK